MAMLQGCVVFPVSLAVQVTNLCGIWIPTVWTIISNDFIGNLTLDFQLNDKVLKIWNSILQLSCLAFVVPLITFCHITNDQTFRGYFVFISSSSNKLSTDIPAYFWDGVSGHVTYQGKLISSFFNCLNAGTCVKWDGFWNGCNINILKALRS